MQHDQGSFLRVFVLFNIIAQFTNKRALFYLYQNKIFSAFVDMPQYIHEQGVQPFKGFKYQGGSDSLTYKYLWSPFGDYLLRFTPSHIAPNTITLTGFILLAITHVIYAIGCAKGQIGSWRFGLMGVSILIYQHLDNLDGKQARKTKTSSPLGMLFDHGADAVSTFFISIQIIETIKLSSGSYKIIALFYVVMLTYFAAMWSQYSTGYFKLGIVNPIDEGLPGYALFALLNIFIPDTIWTSHFLFGEFNQTVMIVLIIGGSLSIFYFVKDNYKNAKRDLADINTLLVIPASYGLVLFLLYLSPKNPLQVARWPIYYCLMFSWARNMIQIQLCQVTKQRFNPFNRGSIGFLIPSLAHLMIDLNTNTYFWLVAALSGVIFMEFAISVTRQAASILDINIFSIKKVHSD